MKLTLKTKLKEIGLKHIDVILNHIFYLEHYKLEEMPQTIEDLTNLCKIHPDAILQRLRIYKKIDKTLGVSLSELNYTMNEVLIDVRLRNSLDEKINQPHFYLYDIKDTPEFFESNKKKKIVFISNKEVRSYSTALFFYMQGFENVKYLEGGLSQNKEF